MIDCIGVCSGSTNSFQCVIASLVLLAGKRHTGIPYLAGWQAESVFSVQSRVMMQTHVMYLELLGEFKGEER